MSVVRRSSIFDPFSLDPLDLSSIANTRAYWKETPVALVFKVDLPGLKKEMVKVEVVEGRILQISGDRSLEREEKNDSWHRVQRSSAKFRRRFRLRKNAKVDQISASVDDGVLTVTFPTVEAKTSQMKSIQCET